MSNLVQLRRYDTSTPWGFRMNGGLEFGQPLYIQKVTGSSIAFKAGLRPGDVLLQIGRSPTQGMTHEQAKMEIIRAGNDVDFILQRDAVSVPHSGEPAPVPMPTGPTPSHTPQTAGVNSGVVEEHNWRSGGPLQDPSVQSRSFKMLQHQLATE